MQHEGPCLLVDWFDRVNPSLSLRTWYYPSSRCSMIEAEDFMLGWMHSRRCSIRTMRWHWGEWPHAMPRSRMTAAGPLPPVS